jgi:hypothetical protein
MLLRDCLQSSSSGGEVVVEFITTLAPIIVGLVALLVGYHYNKRLLTQKNHEDERKEIYKKLNSFYGPVRQLLGTSYEFSNLLRASRPEEFRTLVFLLEGNSFEGNDKVVLQQILEIGKHIERLVRDKSGLVEDKNLYELLWKLSTHIRLIRLASQGKLKGQRERFEEHVFPREIGEKIEKEILRLNTRLTELNAL